MKISLSSERTLSIPEGKPDYPYAATAEVFNTDKLFVHAEVLNPKQKSSSAHAHKLHDEVVYVLEGVIQAIEDDDVHELRAGDSCLFESGNGKKHYLINGGEGTAHYLLVRSAGGGPDVEY